jgi:hypothetical protein
MIYRLLADVIAILHVGWVLFVLLGLVAILIGWALGWGWVRNRWFRVIHLAFIVIVVIRAMFTPVCPLSTWEKDLRVLGGQVDEEDRINYEGHRVGEFFHNIIHPEHVEEWDFTFPPYALPTAYTTFGC